MTFDDAKQYAETILQQKVVRSPEHIEPEHQRVFVYAYQLFDSYTPESFTQHIENERDRVENFKEDYTREVAERKRVERADDL